MASSDRLQNPQGSDAAGDPRPREAPASGSHGLPTTAAVKSSDATVSVSLPPAAAARAASGRASAPLGAFGSGVDAAAAPPAGAPPVSQITPTGLGTFHNDPAGGSAISVPPQGAPLAHEAGDLKKGVRIGKCEIVAMLGKGGMGAVYQARHQTLDIDVALKVITFAPASAAERDEGIARFFREARAAAKVRHENVVSIFDVDADGGVHYMLMEMVDGASARKLCEAGALEAREAARIIRDAARALGNAHRSSIVHRDVKPENILLTRDGRVKVTDFGIAHIQGGDSKLTRTGQIIGTPHYMAPEQIDGLTLDGRADIYALGASLFHLVTGTTPYSGPTALQVCMKHLSSPVPSARERNPSVPEEIEAIIARAMAKAPEARYATADEMADALEPLSGPRRALDDVLAGVSRVSDAASGGASPTPSGGAAAVSHEGVTLRTPPTLQGAPATGALAARNAPTPPPGVPGQAPSAPPPSVPAPPVAAAVPAVAASAPPVAASAPPVPASAPHAPVAAPPRGGVGIMGVIGGVLVGAVLVAVALKAPWSGGAAVGATSGATSGASPGGTSAGGSIGASSSSGASASVAAAAGGAAAPGGSAPPAYSPERQQAIMNAAKLSAAASDLIGQGQIDAAVASLDALADDAIRSGDSTMMQIAAMGLFQGAMALDTANRKKESLARWERLVAAFPELDRTLRRSADESIARLRTVAGADERPIEVALFRETEWAGRRIVAGDMDGDGRPDLALCGSYGTYFTSRGQGPGVLSEKRVWPLDGEGAPEAQIVLHGVAPLAAAGATGGSAATPRAAGAPTLAWISPPWGRGRPARTLLVHSTGADGAGTRASLGLGPAPSGGATDPEDLLAADLDGDGRGDLVGYRQDDRTLTLFQGADGGGWRAPRVMKLPGKVVGISVADATGERRDDIVILVDTEARRGPPLQLLVYAFDAELRLQPADTGAKLEASWPQLVVGDWSGDGVADIALTAQPKDGADRALAFLRSKGKGFFEPVQTKLSLGFVPFGSALVDVDRDGKADLLTLERTGGKETTLYVFLSKGDGTFSASAKHTLTNIEDARAVATADFDGDGKLDIAVYDYARGVGVVFGDGTGRFGNRE